MNILSYSIYETSDNKSSASFLSSSFLELLSIVIFHVLSYPNTSDPIFSQLVFQMYTLQSNEHELIQFNSGV
jgi:hypothetical protein